MNAFALEAGVFDLLIGPQDSSIIDSNASKRTYRFGPNISMMLKPLVRRALALGKKWYFLQADYASKATYHGCDHQCTQTHFMFDIVAEVPASEADQCGDAPAKAAQTTMASQKIADRANYTPKSRS